MSKKMVRPIENRCQEVFSHFKLMKEVYAMYHLDHLSVMEIMQRKGISKYKIYRILHRFEAENPELSEQMKKKSKDLTPDDYRKLLEEVSALKSQLRREKLRADIYEEMVAFGKEVYGIDLKKAGTK